MLKPLEYAGTSGTLCNVTRNLTRNSTRRTGCPAHSVDAARVIAEAANTDFDPPQAMTSPGGEGNQLIVGPNVMLKGSKITDCGIELVIGDGEDSMSCRYIRIAEGSVFSGKVEVDVAEVHGTFTGELTARKRLVVYATGRVRGTIRYGTLVVEKGGILDRHMALHAVGTETAHG